MPSTPDLLAASDTGAFNFDNITNIAKPTFTGAGANGSAVTLHDGNTVIGTGTVSGGVWSITAATALTEGANAISAMQTDVAGNVSGASAVLNVTLDRTPPCGDGGVSIAFRLSSRWWRTGNANVWLQ